MFAKYFFVALTVLLFYFTILVNFLHFCLFVESFPKLKFGINWFWKLNPLQLNWRGERNALHFDSTDPNFYYQVNFARNAK